MRRRIRFSVSSGIVLITVMILTADSVFAFTGKDTSHALAKREMLRGEINRELTHPRYTVNYVLVGTDR